MSEVKMTPGFFVRVGDAKGAPEVSYTRFLIINCDNATAKTELLAQLHLEHMTVTDGDPTFDLPAVVERRLDLEDLSSISAPSPTLPRPLVKPFGSLTLRLLAGRCSPKTIERVFQPVADDIRHEYNQALIAGVSKWHLRSIVIRGRLRLLVKVLPLQAIVKAVQFVVKMAKGE